MQLILLFVVLIIAAPLILYASPIIMYLVPFILVGLSISFLTDYVRHHPRAVRH